MAPCRKSSRCAVQVASYEIAYCTTSLVLHYWGLGVILTAYISLLLGTHDRWRKDFLYSVMPTMVVVILFLQHVDTCTIDWTSLRLAAFCLPSVLLSCMGSAMLGCTRAESSGVPAGLEFVDGDERQKRHSSHNAGRACCKEEFDLVHELAV